MTTFDACVIEINRYFQITAVFPDTLVLDPANYAALERELLPHGPPRPGMQLLSVNGVPVMMDYSASGIYATTNSVPLPSCSPAPASALSALRAIYAEIDTIKWATPITYVGPKCTCGAAKCGSGMHSEWCDIK